MSLIFLIKMLITELSMACALRFCMKKASLMLKGATETANFTENLPWQGLKLGDDGLEKFKDAINYLNNWKNEMYAEHITPSEFLTLQTSQGLRVTLQSTIDLSTYLLEKCDFSYKFGLMKLIDLFHPHKYPFHLVYFGSDMFPEILQPYFEHSCHQNWKYFNKETLLNKNFNLSQVANCFSAILV
ncbi:Uncharacterized protein FWK35_00011912 [Aphis craccivora]|uniref:Uncharacterized protein n=1 Tax=Aphis craccivora TaxID=307492 RepID=A0A6G0Y1T0_APHCR|nr:Uncharacterized protein FWK35_00011912 [Aphis craccivora]